MRLLVFCLVCFYFVCASKAIVVERRQKNQCVFYGGDPTGRPYFNNTPSIALDLNSTFAQNIVDLCGKSGQDMMNRGSVCCSETQFNLMKSRFTSASQIIGSCTACWRNFVNFFCTFTCSPDQSLFVDPLVLDPFFNSVDSASVYVNESLSNGLYDSCKDVKYGADNALAMKYIAHGAESGFGMLNAVGEKNALNPMELIFPREILNGSDTRIQILSFATVSCDDPLNLCSCLDCAKTCAAPDFDMTPISSRFSCSNWKCSPLAYALIIYFLALGLMLLFYILSLRRHPKTQNNIHEESSLLDPNSSNNALEDGEESSCANDDPDAILGVKGEYHPVLASHWPLDTFLRNRFYHYGLFCAHHPLKLILLSILLVGSLSVGWKWFEVETSPIRLWVDPKSPILAQKMYFDEHFGPFYRISQLIFTAKNESTIVNYEALGQIWALQRLIEKQVVVSSVGRDISGTNASITLDDLCFKPTDSFCATQSFVGWFGDAEEFPSDRDAFSTQFRTCINAPGDLSCLSPSKQPMNPNLVLGRLDPGNDGKEKLPWTQAGAALLTFVLNNHVDERANEDAVVWERNLVFFLKKVKLIDLAYSEHRFEEALAMEATIGASVNVSLINFSFSTESSIEDELTRETTMDIMTIVVSYILMFIYVSISLGRWKSVNFMRVLIDSKFCLGIAGVVIVLASVSMSMGLLSMLGVKATLIIAEVIPFLVLAVGVDNIFILVNTFQRLSSSHSRLFSPDKSDDTLFFVPLPAIPLDIRVAKTLSEVGPSILLSSLCSCVAFGTGYWVSMPAVSIFSLYASVSVLCNFLLQLLCFVALMVLDARRYESNRFDCIPCVGVDVDCLHYEDPVKSRESLMERFVRHYYAPFILNFRVRFVVVLLFLTLFCALGVANVRKVELGLDQKSALPKDSYLIDYFVSLEEDLEVGPPLYFVVIADDPRIPSLLNIETIEAQRRICGKFLDCDAFSLGRLLELEFQHPLSTIATPSANWFDDFVLFMNNVERPCCVKTETLKDCYVFDPTNFRYPNPILAIDLPITDDYNSSNHRTDCGCWKWRSYTFHDGTPGHFPPFSNYLGGSPFDDADVGGLMANGTELFASLAQWLSRVPDIKCPNGGKAAYGSAISLKKDPLSPGVEAFHMRTYHPILRTQQDFIDALLNAQSISRTLMSRALNLTDAEIHRFSESSAPPPVFAYSVFYVFFEQYLTISSVAVQLVLYALLGTFVMVSLLLGSPLTAFIIAVLVLMMAVELVGVMSLWGISLNAVSTVNLVIGVGIGVEFCVHIARAIISAPMGFQAETSSSTPQRPHFNARAHTIDSLTTIGTSVLCGITFTKLLGISVLAFAQTTIFEIYYFRMYFTIVLLGALHGLVLLPILLYTLGVGNWRIRHRIYVGPELGLLFVSRVE